MCVSRAETRPRAVSVILGWVLLGFSVLSFSVTEEIIFLFFNHLCSVKSTCLPPRRFLPTSISLNLPCCPSAFRILTEQKQESTLNVTLLEFLITTKHGLSEYLVLISHLLCVVGQSAKDGLCSVQLVFTWQGRGEKGEPSFQKQFCSGSMVFIRECLFWKRHMERMFPLNTDC